MATYNVHMVKTLSTVVTVEADSEHDAMEKAFNSNDMPGGICAQCAGWGRRWSVDDGEWDVPDSDDENPVTLID